MGTQGTSDDRGAPGGAIGETLERLLGKRLYAGRELALSSPVYEPKRKKKLEVGWVNLIFFGWIGWMAFTFFVTGFGVGRTPAPIPFLVAAAIATRILTESLVRRRGMIWPCSKLGLLGPATFAEA
ncbi:MAG: hypothetical protein AAF698_08625, partial [Pseudomonadota bacterium]